MLGLSFGGEIIEMDRLSSDYIQGYTNALLDIKEILNYIPGDLKAHKKPFNSKTIQELMKCCIENRRKLRDRAEGFIRYNGVTKEFEWFNGE